MKKTVLAASLAALLPLSIPAVKAAEPTPEIEISGNVSLVSDYRFRGISQTNRDPAVQGGFDLTHKSGLYVGTWASNVSQWANPGGSMEIDFYGGYSTELPMGIGLDIGHIWYQYPGNDPSLVDPDAVSNRTREWYVGLSYGFLSYNFSRSTTNWFGIDESKGSSYHSLGVEYSPIEKLTLSATAGYQKIKGDWAGETSFKDYSVTGSYDLGDGYSIGLAYHKVSFKNRTEGQAWFTGSDGSDIAKSRVVASLTKEF
jgi:uncharacterized protein (TIGR02001 family)